MGGRDDGVNVVVAAPMTGSVVTVGVAEGDRIRSGQQLLVLEAMKLHHAVPAPVDGVVRQLAVTVGDLVQSGTKLVELAPETSTTDHAPDTPLGARDDAGHDGVRADLAAVIDRHAVGLDEARPEAVARRRRTGQRTARENVADLCDPDSFLEYGALAIAAQRRRRPVEELIRRTPADGIVTGIGTVNAAAFPPDRTRTVVLAYDFTVLAGTQGLHNHRKTDRMLELAARDHLPVVLFAEGGGGRPGDTDVHVVTGLETPTFSAFARLSGQVPLIGIVSGRCFAGNAVLLGCCDVIIATEGSNIGMAGPAMIEGGGLGVFDPEDIGSVADQTASGVIDVLVADEAAAVTTAKRYLGYLQGPTSDWTAGDQHRLRSVVPEDRLRGYDVHTVLSTLADTDSVLELRPTFGRGMVTALARIEGRPVGILANDPTHLAGAITSDGADKAARFLQQCDVHGVPVVTLVDTPGMMVGPDTERTGLVRHSSRLFLATANLAVPLMSIVLRKGYGLGAQAMCGGHLKAGGFTVAWPTGEFGPMGIEGQVRLGYRDELAAITDDAQREERVAEMVAGLLQQGGALNVASYAELDDVIDPADSRRWIVGTLAGRPSHPIPSSRRYLDSW